jgi:hypothetical protein
MKRSNIHKREFSPTGLEDHMRCPRLFYYKKFLKLQSADSTVDLHFGKAIHAGVAEFYRNYKTPGDFTISKISAIREFSEFWKSENQVGTQKKSLPSGIDAISRYCDTYRYTTEFYQTDLIEMEQTIAMPNGTYLVMVLDRIFKSGNYIRVDDTKTTSSALTDFYFRTWENSFQLLCYAYAVEQITGACDGIQVDAIRLPIMKDSYIRRTFQPTELQRVDFLNTYERETNLILAALLEAEPVLAFPCRQKACSDYGGCKYINICKYGLDYPDVKDQFNIAEEIEV